MRRVGPRVTPSPQRPGPVRDVSGCAIIVPARLASTRFPRKLLHEIRGKPLLLWTADRVRAAAPDMPLWFAVDDERLRTVLDDAGYHVLMTDSAHPTGTDRIAEANRTISAEYVINVQADEPMVTKEQIDQLAHLIRRDEVMATLGAPVTNPADFTDPTKAKCVLDAAGHALYFSRAPIPYSRETEGAFDPALGAEPAVLIHLGLYAYRGDFLEAFSQLPPGRLEDIEKLEMLRALEYGYRIAVGVTEDASVGIDTRAQADAFEALVERLGR